MSNKKPSMIRYNISSGGSVLIPFDIYINMTDEDFLDLECRQFSSNMKYIVSDEFTIDDTEKDESLEDYYPEAD